MSTDIFSQLSRFSATGSSLKVWVLLEKQTAVHSVNSRHITCEDNEKDYDEKVCLFCCQDVLPDEGR